MRPSCDGGTTSTHAVTTVWRRVAGTGAISAPACPTVRRNDDALEANVRLSIRNQLGGTIQSLTRGEVMGIVRLRLDGGQEITSAITLEAVDDLGLVDGQHVTVLVKSTDVAISSNGVSGLSVRNQVPGTVER